MKKTILVLGLGWLGETLAVNLHEQGFEVKGTTTSLSKLKRLAHLPFYVTRLELCENDIKGDLQSVMADVELIVITIPPGRQHQHLESYLGRMAFFLSKVNPSLKVIYTSSTGVYGNGELITETAPVQAKRAGAQEIVKVEALLHNKFGENLTILRLGGLIGPGRHPGRFFAANRAVKNPKGSVNLLHLNDAVNAIKAVIDKQLYGEIINLCSSTHPQRGVFYQTAAKSLNSTPPGLDSVGSIENKVIDNSKSKHILGFQYQYDDLMAYLDIAKLGKVSIVGAGPGSTDLLTIEAYRLINEAEIILHDKLVPHQLLLINSEARHEDVGRIFGEQSSQKERQEKINTLLKKYYFEGAKVVRLKSGDPYIYGRAAEEARFLKEEKIPFNVVPGISAALAAADRFNVPITERYQSNAVLICTAHTADDNATMHFDAMVSHLNAGNTLAVYMGLHSLEKFIPRLLDVCDADVPVCAISKVARDDEQIMVSSLGGIIGEMKRKPLPTPVVFLVGAKPIA